MKVTADRILVLPIKEEATHEFYVVSKREKPSRGKVVNKGKLVDEVKIGDMVLFGTSAGSSITIDDKEHIILREPEIYCIL